MVLQHAVVVTLILGSLGCARLDPKIAIGTYQTENCAYECNFLSVFPGDCFEDWSSGELRVPKLRGSWKVDSAECISMEVASPESQGVSHFDAGMYEVMRSFELCFRDNGVVERIWHIVKGDGESKTSIEKYVRASKAAIDVRASAAQECHGSGP